MQLSSINHKTAIDFYFLLFENLNKNRPFISLKLCRVNDLLLPPNILLLYLVSSRPFTFWSVIQGQWHIRGWIKWLFYFHFIKLKAMCPFLWGTSNVQAESEHWKCEAVSSMRKSWISILQVTFVAFRDNVSQYSVGNKRFLKMVHFSALLRVWGKGSERGRAQKWARRCRRRRVGQDDVGG